jgi:hypothetical protein
MLIDILAILAAIGCFIIAIVIAIKERDLEALAIWLLLPVIGILWSILTIILGSALPKQPVYERVTLQNINDNVGASGQFFLGIGGFENEGKFFYYAKKDGFSKFKNVDADNAEIYEGSAQAYALERKNCKSGTEWLVECVYWSDYVKFYVPSNTIKSNYKMDAQ